MVEQRNNRMEELENRFSQLEPRIKESPEKEAISILHALIHESRRAASNQESSSSRAFETVANLYKAAPAMSGRAENSGLPVGSPAPDFVLPDANGKPVALSDYRGQQIVLVFYPLDWSPACSDQLSLYQGELEEFKKLNAVVLGISVDSLYSHGAWAAVRGITFPMLSDFQPHGEVARRYQVFRPNDGFSERALYIIDQDGLIRYQHISPELPKIPNIYELFSALKVHPSTQVQR